jgi:hypothetical protein
MYCHVCGICVTNKTGFGFYDRIYWTFIQLVTRSHKSLSDTLSSSSDWTIREYYSDFQRTVNYFWVRPQHRKHLLQLRFCCCMRVLRAVPRNWSTLLLVAYFLRSWLPSLSRALCLHVTVLITTCSTRALIEISHSTYKVRTQEQKE